MPALPPLSLYIHIPWCVKKCPYCDFNSHVAKQAEPPFAAYTQALIRDLKNEKAKTQGRAINSIFIGGGTPSLMPGHHMQELFHFIDNEFDVSDDCEITLEANPGAVDERNFSDYLSAGINRLSIGVQSFSDTQLHNIGRIHKACESLRAFELARKLGFQRINTDIIFALPSQSIAEALDDLQQAIALSPEHISWYQLTIEPNTYFYSKPPAIPDDDIVGDIFEQGQNLLQQHGFEQYEVSAYARAGEASRHNLNYWRFGDYLAIGAGAHGKQSSADGSITRYWKTRSPKDYMARYGERHIAVADELTLNETLSGHDKRFEFLLNALRLNAGFDIALFEQATGCAFSSIAPAIEQEIKTGLLERHGSQIKPSIQGHRFLNILLERLSEALE